MKISISFRSINRTVEVYDSNGMQEYQYPINQHTLVQGLLPTNDELWVKCKRSQKKLLILEKNFSRVNIHLDLYESLSVIDDSFSKHAQLSVLLRRKGWGRKNRLHIYQTYPALITNLAKAVALLVTMSLGDSRRPAPLWVWLLKMSNKG